MTDYGILVVQWLCAILGMAVGVVILTLILTAMMRDPGDESSNVPAEVDCDAEVEVEEA